MHPSRTTLKACCGCGALALACGVLSCLCGSQLVSCSRMSIYLKKSLLPSGSVHSGTYVCVRACWCGTSHSGQGRMQAYFSSFGIDINIQVLTSGFWPRQVCRAHQRTSLRCHCVDRCGPAASLPFRAVCQINCCMLKRCEKRSPPPCRQSMLWVIMSWCRHS